MSVQGLGVEVAKGKGSASDAGPQPPLLSCAVLSQGQALGGGGDSGGTGLCPCYKAGRALVQVESSGLLLADAGFDGGGVWAKAQEKGLEPHIPLKGGGELRDEQRKKAR